MSDKGRIKVDYDKALSQANKLDELSKQCEEQLKKMGKMMGSLPEIWQGRSAISMLERCQVWLNAQLQQSVILSSEANAIREVVNELKEAERKTIEEINIT